MQCEHTRALLRGVMKKAIAYFILKKESLLCFHGKSRLFPGLPLIWSSWSFSLFTPLSHPVIHPCLKSSCHCHLPHSASCSVADGDWLTQQLRHSSRGEKRVTYQKDLPKAGVLDDGFILIKGQWVWKPGPVEAIHWQRKESVDLSVIGHAKSHWVREPEWNAS